MKTATQTPYTQGVQGSGPVIGGLKDDSKRLKIYGDQHVLVIADDSGSMSGSKAAEASSSIGVLATELANPANKDGFRVTTIKYGSNPTLLSSMQEASAVQCTLDGNSGGTELAPALVMAAEQMKKWQVRQNRQARDPVIVVFSDGCLGDQGAALKEAARLKADGVTIVSIGFGSDVDEATMRSLASEGGYAFADVGGLKALFAQVGRTLSQAMAA